MRYTHSTDLSYLTNLGKITVNQNLAAEANYEYIHGFVTG